jgi:hypothetical protein
MTANWSQKQVIRQRQARTGEKYTTARRVIVAIEETVLGLLADQPHTRDEVIGLTSDLRAGEVSAVLAALVRAHKVTALTDGRYQLPEAPDE